MLLEGQFPNVYFRAYKGSLDINEDASSQALTGTISFSPSSLIITGSGTSFLDELHPGQMIQAAGGEVIVVVGRPTSQTSFIADRLPFFTGSEEAATILGIIGELDVKRYTLVRGNAAQFDKGTILAVGDGILLVNGQPLAGDSLDASRQVQVAVYDSATMTYDVQSLGFTEIPVVTNSDVSVITSGGVKNMSVGYYSLKVAYYSDITNGYGNPTDTLLEADTDGYHITVTNSTLNIDFSGDVGTRPAKATGYIVYGSAFAGSSDISKTNSIQGGWFEVNRVAFANLVAQNYTFEYTDSELASLVSFDNDTPPDAEFISTIDNYPFLVSTDGQGVDSTGRETSTSPGAFVAPAKPDNLDAYPATYKVPTSKGETILGVVQAAGRFFVMTPNTLQAVTPTGLPAAPFTCRPFWRRGFINPYNLIFVDDTLYGYSGRKLFRSTGTADEANESYQFASDVEAQLAESSGGYVFIAHDPKNELICVFLSAIRTNDDGFWETDVYPYSLTKSIWMPKVVLSSTTQDMVVSGAATVNNELYFVAGGRTPEPPPVNPCDGSSDSFFYVAGITDPIQQAAITQLISDLQGYGIWDKCDAIYPFVGGNANSHSYNLKNTCLYQITWHGGVTHNADGITGNGTTGYGDSNLNPFTVQTPDDTHLSLYSRTSVDLPEFDLGALDGVIRYGMYVRYSDFFASEMYREAATPPNTLGVTNFNGEGFYSGSRLATNNFKIFKNGAVRVSTVLDNGGGTLPTQNLFISALNSDGIAGNFSSRNFAFLSIGDGLTSGEEADFFTAVQAFQTALGREVGTEYLSDTFANGSIDTGVWQVDGVTVTETTSLEITGTTTAFLRTITPYDLTGHYAAVKFTDVPAANVGYQQQFVLSPDDTFASYYLALVYNGDLIWRKAGGVIYAAAYNAVTHAYLMMRFAGGTAYFYTSADGFIWTFRASEATAITITALYIYMRTDNSGVSVTQKWNDFTSDIPV